MINKVLLPNNFIYVLENKTANKDHSCTNSLSQESFVSIGTLLNNLAYYGFVPSQVVFEKFLSLEIKEIQVIWEEIEPILKEITGANRNMGDFVVYKNFPKEVLNMSQAEYWFNQINMYWGVPVKIFAQEKKVRPINKDLSSLKVLHFADYSSLPTLFNGLLSSPKKWTDAQFQQAVEIFNLMQEGNIFHSLSQLIDIDCFSFKGNAIRFMSWATEDGKKVNKAYTFKINNATDVLRLAAYLSCEDFSLHKQTKFKKFSRPERKQFLSLLNDSKNLLDDVSLRPEMWKRFLKQLHPGDYSYDKVKQVYHALYQGKTTSFQCKVASLIKNNDIEVLSLLESRPGEFLRAFHHLYSIFGEKVVDSFKKISEHFTVQQLLSFKGYINTINERKFLLYPPKGNWNKVILKENNKVEISSEVVKEINLIIEQIIKNRLNAEFKQGFSVYSKTKFIKLPGNDQELANGYGRGTAFDIPNSINYIRTASYWKMKTYSNTWFDNSWNFFNESWEPLFTTCWNATNTKNKGAIFSGDPVNSQELEGRACQMIDLDIKKLIQNGVRYAVWNILSYNIIKFNEAEDVLATLQLCEDNESGELYEPSRSQFVFPLKGESITKYIAYLDLVERKIVYIDANFKGSICSAVNNEKTLKEQMPAFIEYLNSLPSVHDLFSCGEKGDIPILYTDEKVSIKPLVVDVISEEKEKVLPKAYVFKPLNKKNEFESIVIQEILKK